MSLLNLAQSFLQADTTQKLLRFISASGCNHVQLRPNLQSLRWLALWLRLRLRLWG